MTEKNIDEMIRQSVMNSFITIGTEMKQNGLSTEEAMILIALEKIRQSINHLCTSVNETYTINILEYYLNKLKDETPQKWII